MSRYWDRGNRAEWHALGRKRPEPDAATAAAAAKAFAEIWALFENDPAPDPQPEDVSVSRETCKELGHSFVDHPGLLHTVHCERCGLIAEHPKRFEAERRRA